MEGTGLMAGARANRKSGANSRQQTQYKGRGQWER